MEEHDRMTLEFMRRFWSARRSFVLLSSLWIEIPSFCIIWRLEGDCLSALYRDHTNGQAGV